MFGVVAWAMFLIGTVEVMVGIVALPSPADQIVGGSIGVICGLGGIIINAVSD